MDLPFAARVALGHPRLALVEQFERALDGVANLALGRGRDAVARFKRAVDGGFEGGQRHRGFLGAAAIFRGAFSGFGGGESRRLVIAREGGRSSTLRRL